MLKKMDENSKLEREKVNMNLGKLLNLIEAHNHTLDDIERKFKNEFKEIKDNIKRIKAYQVEQEKAKTENAEYKRIIAGFKKEEAEQSHIKVQQNKIKKDIPIVKQSQG